MYQNQHVGPSLGQGTWTTGGNAVDAATKESPVSMELNGLINGLVELEHMVSDLQTALQPVSLPPTPQPSAPTGGGAPTPPASTRGVVCDAISTSAERVRGLVAHVAYIKRNLSV